MRRAAVVLALLLAATAAWPQTTIVAPPYPRSVSKALVDAAAATTYMAVTVPADSTIAGYIEWTAQSASTYVAASYIYTYTDANLPAAGDTVVVTDGVTPKTYTWVAAVAAEGDVKITTADASALALTRALNKSGGTNAVGGDYLVAAANPLVSAVQSDVGAGTGTITATARTTGTLGNAVNINETSAGAAFFASHALETGSGNTLTTIGRVRFAGAAAGVTPVCTIGLVGTDLAAVSGGANTLVCTWTNLTASQTCALSVTCTNNEAGDQAITLWGRPEFQYGAAKTFP